MGELSGTSTRADITPTSFINEYNWGDLKANPAKLLQRYFDVFVYVANWGTHRLGLRIPNDALDLKTAGQYLIGDRASSKVGKGCVVVDLWSDVEYPEDWEDGRGWMASLARRAEKERKRREAVEAKARTKHLDASARRENAAWKEVEQLVSSKRPKAYDDAVVLLRDLRDLAERAKNPERFTSKVTALTVRHSGKRSFVARLCKAGLTA